MKRFAEYIALSERAVNLFQRDTEKREDLADEVWAILQASYKDIGGIKGSGFENKQSMIDNVPFWKLVRRDGKIVAVVMYKDRGGRKLVAVGSDGSDAGKKGILDIIKDDLKQQRSFGEFSDRLLAFIIKNLGVDEIKKNAIKRSRLSQLLETEEILEPEANDFYVQKYPALKDYFYRREIGGKLHTKISFGTSGKKLVAMG
jgi:hypothetical protein